MENLLNHHEEFESWLGDDWPEFREALDRLMRELLDAADDERLGDIEGITDRIAALCQESAGRLLFVHLLSDAAAQAADPAMLAATFFDLAEAIRALGMALAEGWHKAAIGPQPEPPSDPTPPGGLEKGLPQPRFLNAGFFYGQSRTEGVPVGESLFTGSDRFLGVNAGKTWGIGTPPSAEFGIDPAVGSLFEEQDQLRLTVAVRSRSVLVENGYRQLVLPREGESELLFFRLTFGSTGRHILDVDLFYQSHLLQSRRVEVDVVEDTGEPVPPSKTAQDSYLTFSRAGTLSRDKLQALDEHPRRLTITVQKQDDRFCLYYYNHEQEALGMERSELGEANLQTLLNNSRKALKKVVADYRGRIGGSQRELRLSLWRLASEGFQLFRKLLPVQYDPTTAGPGAVPVALGLTAGDVIQVAPLSRKAGLPWELLYDRRVDRFREHKPDRVALCDQFLSHGPDDCPNRDNAKVVCPYGFWGFRYIVEQLPNRIPFDQPPPAADLPLHVRNGMPLRFAALVYEFDNLEEHIAGLQALDDDLDLVRVDSLDAAEKELTTPEEPADILYFYAHGGFDQNEPELTLGPEDDEFELTTDDLEAWDVDLTARQPLVVLNACESAAYRPDRVDSLLETFTRRGASGLIGTQCEVPTKLADAFIQAFFQAFLHEESVGQALFAARKALLHHVAEGPGGPERRPDPRGLVYSLFAAADIALAQPLD
jgi:hypothetical protein